MPTPPRCWIEPAPITPSSDLVAACGEDQLLAGILARRGLDDPQRVRAFLDPDAYQPTPPSAIPDLASAAALLQRAIDARQRILIWGDFDVDGQTATALLYDGLTRAGGDAVYHVPDRLTEGHGIRLPMLNALLDRYAPSLLLTCDTGVTEFESIAQARARGLAVIVTDHHELGAALPEAEAVVNPRRLPDGHPLVNLPGVGVAFALMQQLFAGLGRSQEVADLLDLVALGIVGDVAMQTDDTRYLLQRGLSALRVTGRIGLQALLQVAAVSPEAVSADQIAFQIAPRLNAAGRLGDAALSVELLTTSDRGRAAILAQQLEGLNAERRVQTRQIEIAADDMLAEHTTLLTDGALVLYHPQWHTGLLGIVANSLATRYGRPVILCGGGADGIAKGSARAPSGYDIFSAIQAHAPLLVAFGGHRSAAGLSIPVGKIDQFRRLVARTMRESGQVPDVPHLLIDVILPLDQVTLGLAERLARLGPFGEGNPRVTLASLDVTLDHTAKIGRQSQHRKLTVRDADGATLPLLWWESAREDLPEGRFDVAYQVAGNARGEVEATLVAWRLREAPTSLPPAAPRTVFDWRGERDPLAKLHEIVSAAEAVGPGSADVADVADVANVANIANIAIWAEAFPRSQHPTWKRRADLSKAHTLVIFTAPSDDEVMADVLARVRPDVVHLFALLPPITTPEAVLQHLAVAVRNVLERHRGVIALEVLCGATAQSAASIRAGLAVLAARGQIGSVSVNRSLVRLTPAEGSPPPPTHAAAEVAAAEARFDRAVEEVAAFRRFFRQMPLDALTERQAGP